MENKKQPDWGEDYADVTTRDALFGVALYALILCTPAFALGMVAGWCLRGYLHG